MNGIPPRITTKKKSKRTTFQLMKLKLKTCNPKEGKKGGKREHRTGRIHEKYGGAIIVKHNSNYVKFVSEVSNPIKR